MDNAVDETKTKTEATDGDKPAAEIKNPRRPRPAYRFEVLLNIYGTTSVLLINDHLRTC